MKRKNLLLTACLAVLASGNVMAADATWTATTVDDVLTDQYFSLLSPTIGWRGGTYDAATKTFTFTIVDNEGKVANGGQDGWWYTESPINVSKYKYLNITMNPQANSFYEIHLYANGDWRIACSATEETCLSNGTIHQTIDLSKVYYKTNNVIGTTSYDISAAFKGFYFWDSWDEDHVLSVANVFLTATEPDWTKVVSKTPSESYGTICLPYVSTAVGAYIYQITGKSTDGKSIYITPYNGLLKAGVPYIYKALTAKTAVNFYEISSGTEATATTNNGLVGMYTGNAAKGDNYYVIKNDQLYQVNSSDVALTNGAYIDLGQLTKVAGSAKGFSIELGDGTTGISDINKDNTTSKDNAIYTITGVKVSNDQQRGIYIKNGKKYIKNN